MDRDIYAITIDPTYHEEETRGEAVHGASNQCEVPIEDDRRVKAIEPTNNDPRDDIEKLAEFQKCAKNQKFRNGRNVPKMDAAMDEESHTIPIDTTFSEEDAREEAAHRALNRCKIPIEDDSRVKAIEPNNAELTTYWNNRYWNIGSIGMIPEFKMDIETTSGEKHGKHFLP